VLGARFRAQAVRPQLPVGPLRLSACTDPILRPAGGGPGRGPRRRPATV